MSAGASYGQSSGSSKSNLTPQQYLDLYTQSLPTVLGTLSGQVGPISETQAATGAGLLDRYGNQYQQAGQNMELEQAAHTNRLLSGAGGNAARTATALNTELNPAQAAANQGAATLVGSYNMNGLSPGEQNAVERETNRMGGQTGNLGLNNPLNTVANAMNFGREFQRKQESFGNAVNTATNVASAQNQQVNPLAVAMGASNTANNFGLNQFNPSANVETPFQYGSAWGNQLGGVASASRSSNKSMNASAQGGCCFIMLEAYHGTMPEHVRKCRDKYYAAFPDIATGYKRMARWLVPAMRRSTLVRFLVWFLMVKPLTEWGRFVTRQDITKKSYKIARQFWFTLWNITGKI